MRRVIITGATGAIGTALIKELISKEVEILVLCNPASSRNGRIPDHRLVQKVFCSLQQINQLENTTGKEYDVFYHFAWEGTTGQARNDMYLQNRNVQYALDAVKAADRFGCKKFIGSGSQAEYGRTEDVLKPNTPVFPENGYGMGKLTAGLMTREFARQLGMKHIWVRILSIYGPNDGAQSVIMSTIAKLQQGESPKLTKGEQMWDFLYSEDAAEALYLLGEKGEDGKTYVLGSGKAEPLRKYIEIVRDMIDPDIKLVFGSIPYSEKQTMYLCADITAIQEDTGWTPKTNFQNGIKRIITA